MWTFKGLEMENVETLTVPNPNQLYLQNGNTGKTIVSNVIGQSGLSSFASSSGGGTKNGHDVSQVLMAACDSNQNQIYLCFLFLKSEINV